jgi:hypothetical protein
MKLVKQKTGPLWPVSLLTPRWPYPGWAKKPTLKEKRPIHAIDSTPPLFFQDKVWLTLFCPLFFALPSVPSTRGGLNATMLAGFSFARYTYITRFWSQIRYQETHFTVTIFQIL